MKIFHIVKINENSSGSVVYLLRVQALTRRWRVFLAEVSTTKQSSLLRDSFSGSTAKVSLLKFSILTEIRKIDCYARSKISKSNLSFVYFELISFHIKLQSCLSLIIRTANKYILCSNTFTKNWYKKLMTLTTMEDLDTPRQTSRQEWPNSGKLIIHFDNNI